ncbi:hypothetical protein PAMA_002765 [Pampus argenteus]
MQKTTGIHSDIWSVRTRFTTPTIRRLSPHREIGATEFSLCRFGVSSEVNHVAHMLENIQTVKRFNHTANATYAGDQMKYCPFKLHYFDRLLQENMTGMAVCKNSGMSPDVASPVVSCKTSITVKLPGGAKLRKVKELDFFTNEGFSVRQQNTPNALYVEISKLPDMVSQVENMVQIVKQFCKS